MNNKGKGAIRKAACMGLAQTKFGCLELNSAAPVPFDLMTDCM